MYILIYVCDRTCETPRILNSLAEAQKIMLTEYEKAKSELFEEIEIPVDDERFEINELSAWINGGLHGYETEYHNDWYIREIDLTKNNIHSLG